MNEPVGIQKMAHNNFSHIVTIDEQNELRNSINNMKWGISTFLTEEKGSSETIKFIKTFFADHAISKIIEGYNSEKI